MKYLLLGLIFILSSCSGLQIESVYPVSTGKNEIIYARNPAEAQAASSSILKNFNKTGLFAFNVTPTFFEAWDSSIAVFKEFGDVSFDYLKSAVYTNYKKQKITAFIVGSVNQAEVSIKITDENNKSIKNPQLFKQLTTSIKQRYTKYHVNNISRIQSDISLTREESKKSVDSMIKNAGFEISSSVDGNFNIKPISFFKDKKKLNEKNMSVSLTYTPGKFKWKDFKFNFDFFTMVDDEKIIDVRNKKQEKSFKKKLKKSFKKELFVQYNKIIKYKSSPIGIYHSLAKNVIPFYRLKVADEKNLTLVTQQIKQKNGYIINFTLKINQKNKSIDVSSSKATVIINNRKDFVQLSNKEIKKYSSSLIHFLKKLDIYGYKINLVMPNA